MEEHHNLKKLDKSYLGKNKRFNLRYGSTTLVSIKAPGKPRLMGQALDLSTDGALLHVEGLNPSRHDRLLIAFIIKLNNGRLLKLHFRDAIVCHITGGNFGVLMSHRIKMRN